MIIIPAIDIKNGKCVRLRQGQMDSETIFSDNPAAMAKQWEHQGAELIHVVDLDGAIAKIPKNIASIEAIVKAVHTPIQIGGGIRNEDTVKTLLDLGVSRVIIGTEAMRNPDFVKTACKSFPEKIAVGIDARNGKVAVEGWTEITSILAIDLARQFEDCGVAAIIFTDIHRDGMQTGPNIEETHKMAKTLSVPVIASGGVSNIEDIKRLLPIGVAGVIVGRALYSKTLNLKEAISISRKTLSAGRQ